MGRHEGAAAKTGGGRNGAEKRGALLIWRSASEERAGRERSFWWQVRVHCKHVFFSSGVSIATRGVGAVNDGLQVRCVKMFYVLEFYSKTQGATSMYGKHLQPLGLRISWM